MTMMNQEVNSGRVSITHILFFVGLILTLTFAVKGQTSSGFVEVSGVVMNTSEEVIPGARVILRLNDGRLNDGRRNDGRRNDGRQNDGRQNDGTMQQRE